MTLCWHWGEKKGKVMGEQTNTPLKKKSSAVPNRRGDVSERLKKTQGLVIPAKKNKNEKRIREELKNEQERGDK